MKSSHQHRKGAALLETLDLAIAEQEISAFSDLLQGKVDLIPGTKGSGKSALFRMFVDCLPKQKGKPIWRRSKLNPSPRGFLMRFAIDVLGGGKILNCQTE